MGKKLYTCTITKQREHNPFPSIISSHSGLIRMVNNGQQRLSIATITVNNG